MREPIPFTLRPECPKCRGDRFDWQIVALDGSTLESPSWTDPIGGELILITCQRCGWVQHMRAADVDK